MVIRFYSRLDIGFSRPAVSDVVAVSLATSVTQPPAGLMMHDDTLFVRGAVAHAVSCGQILAPSL